MEIKNLEGKVIYTIDAETLSGADLSRADLSRADLSDADLSSADLSRADLSDARLYGADLSRADLSDADLSGADLRGADLRHARLYGADLRHARLYGADLSGADLREVSIENVLYNEYTAFFALVPPEEGSFVAWKKVDKYFIKLQIPEDAKRSSATSRKCRCDKAMVLGIYDDEKHLLDLVKVDNNTRAHTEYIVGKMVYPDSWDDDRWDECSHGIHFFLTFDEAKNYSS